MPINRFDQASRYTVKIDPPGFLAWALGLPDDGFAFAGWLDTRGVSFPAGADRTGDTVARLEEPSGAEPPWAVAVEFQTEPDATMFGRLLVYLGNLWLAAKSDEERGGRFHVGAVVVNLTGTGLATRRMEWPAAGLATHLVAVERNLERESADELLVAIEGGTRSRALLPWIPLMTGGSDAGIIERWKRAAEGEPNYHRRNALLLPTLIFAEAADRDAVWTKGLEGWNMKVSRIAEGLVAEGEAKGKAEGALKQAAVSVVAVLEARFGSVPPEVEAAVRERPDLPTLQSWLTLAAKAATLDEFRTTAGV
ncbi:hypothetical protein [Gemmata sp.]|uniref:hypothetical protein n=1 Tax=Gemmata sp. TaxID=1914242 RepID=UPI003F72585D